MRALLLAFVGFAGCAQPLTAQRPPAPGAAPPAQASRSVASQGRARATICSYSIPGQPEFGMTCKER